MPEKTEEEKLREELLRKAQEEQEKYAAEQEERRLSEEARRQYDETKRILDEHVEYTKQAFEDMGKYREEMSKRFTELEAKKFEEEWQRTFSRWTYMAVGAMREVMQRSMSRSIDSSTVGQLAPGLGETGRQMGSMLGGFIGSAFGPVGTMIGKTIGGPIVDMIAMQAEGYNMLGARVARQAYGGGREIDKNFEKIGQDYRLMVNQVVRETGATAEAVGQAFDALSKANVGFEEGGKEMAKFALGADRVLNLRSGRTLQMETELITKYGESAKQARSITRDLVDAMAYFNVESSNTSSAFMKAFASGETLANTLEQISSAARSSGASLDALNGMAIMFVTTVANAGTMRPGEVAESGARVISGLMPGAQSTPAAEAKRSGVDRMMLQNSRIGQRMITKIMKEGDALGMGQSTREQMFDSLATVHFSRQGHKRGDEYRYLAGMIEGSRNLSKGDIMKQWAMLGERNFTSKDMINLQSLQKEMGEAGVFDAKDPGTAMRRFMKEKEKDPKYAETVKHMRGFMDEAKRQGDAQASTLDKISDHLTKMSVWFNRSYWTHGRDAIAEAFGLGPKPSMLSMIAGVAGLAPRANRGIGDLNMGAAAALGITPSMLGIKPAQGSPSPGGSSNISRQEVHLSPEMHDKMASEATANASGLQTTGQ